MVRNKCSHIECNIYSAFVSSLVPSRNSTKAVQTEDRMSSLDFPTPPPAITDATEYSEQPPDEYLSLKVNCLPSPFPLTTVSLGLKQSGTVIFLSFVPISLKSISVNRSLAEWTDRKKQKKGIKTHNSR